MVLTYHLLLYEFKNSLLQFTNSFQIHHFILLYLIFKMHLKLLKEILLHFQITF